MNDVLLVAQLGTIDYQEAWDLQRTIARARRHDSIPDALLLLQHPHTYTLGRRAKSGHVLLSRAELNRQGIPLYEVDRGGDVTYHGPGQLVGYPIMKRSAARIDYTAYIRQIEQVVVGALTRLGIPAECKDGFSGVWIADEKICAIGIKIDAYGITSHGFALNVNTDLSYFAHIVPCGITDKGVTSLQHVLGYRVSMRRVINAVVASMEDSFQRSACARSVGLTRLQHMAATA